MPKVLRPMSPRTPWRLFFVKSLALPLWRGRRDIRSQIASSYSTLCVDIVLIFRKNRALILSYPPKCALRKESFPSRDYNPASPAVNFVIKNRSKPFK